MGSIIVLHASILTEFPVVGVLDRGGAVELFNPHSHTNIFHLEELQ
jgi:hypothetical protein